MNKKFWEKLKYLTKLSLYNDLPPKSLLILVPGILYNLSLHKELINLIFKDKHSISLRLNPPLSSSS
jgi:hypothetical protein